MALTSAIVRAKVAAKNSIVAITLGGVAIQCFRRTTKDEGNICKESGDARSRPLTGHTRAVRKWGQSPGADFRFLYISSSCIVPPMMILGTVANSASHDMATPDAGGNPNKVNKIASVTS